MPVTDPSVPAALSKLLGDDRIAVHLSQTLTTPGNSCDQFFSSHNLQPVYSQLATAVDNQQWFDAQLSIISEFDAGLYEPSPGVPAFHWKALLDNSKDPDPWVSCDFAHHAGLVAKSQATTDGVNNHGTDAYYTDRKSLFNYIVPGTIVHEALHNLTGKTDDELRSDILFIPQPGSNGTFDITQKVEDIGCAPKVKK